MKKCGKCKNTYEDLQIRKCPRSNVQKAYGKHICVYCCKKCPSSEQAGTGFKCTYLGKGEN
jgi:hypothetical protein